LGLLFVWVGRRAANVTLTWRQECGILTAGLAVVVVILSILTILGFHITIHVG
jgi:hypothetical protein